MKNTAMKNIHWEKCSGRLGEYSLEINVSENLPEHTVNKEIRKAIMDASESIKKAYMSVLSKNNLDNIKQTERNRKEITSLFDEPIFVEEIPNGYCSDWCCKHLPWFIVTTKVGRIKIGWRKRVIEIDWEDSLNKTPALELFPNEECTRYDYMIHAWSLEDAKRYIQAITAN